MVRFDIPDISVGYRVWYMCMVPGVKCLAGDISDQERECILTRFGE
jgi:hypothetical protein